MKNTKEKGMVGILVVLAVVGALAFSLYLRSHDEILPPPSVPNPADTPKGKVAASDLADGEYYAYLESINVNPEDTSLTFEHVMYVNGEVSESSEPHFTAPVTLATEEVVTALRNKMANIGYKPVFLVKIQNGAVLSVEEVGRK